MQTTSPNGTTKRVLLVTDLVDVELSRGSVYLLVLKVKTKHRGPRQLTTGAQYSEGGTAQDRPVIFACEALL
jgi:hypothetical protein